MNDRDKLRECPLCNDDTQVYARAVALEMPLMAYAVQCKNCGTRGPVHRNPTKAICLWNTRPKREIAAATAIMQGEPVAWMYQPTNTDAESFAQPNRANMDKRIWTETPLYAHPPMPADVADMVERLEGIDHTQNILEAIEALRKPEVPEAKPWIIVYTIESWNFWKTDEGWVTDIAKATRFTNKERDTLRLPIYGAWMHEDLLEDI